MNWESIFDSDGKAPDSDIDSFTMWLQFSVHDTSQIDEKAVLHSGVLLRIDHSKESGPKERFLILNRDKLYFKSESQPKSGVSCSPGSSDSASFEMKLKQSLLNSD